MEIALVLILLVIAVILFASEKFPVDFVAVMLLGALLVLGLVSMEEGLSGFSNPATITVGAMFVLSAGLRKTGAVGALGRILIRMGRNRTVMLLMIMFGAGIISAFINNTAAVAVFLPIVVAAGLRRKISPSKLLIPLSFASQFGGICTLIGTSTNLLVSSISAKAGHGAFEMFEFTPMGVILLATGVVYFLVLGRWLLPDRAGEQLTERYQLGDYITELRVQENSPLIGKTIQEIKFGETHDATVLEILREEKKIWSPNRIPLREGDVLLVRGKIKDLMDLKATENLEIEPEFKLQDKELQAEDVVLVEALVSPRSRLIGQNLGQMDFRRRYNALVLAIQRQGQLLREKLNQVQFQFGDALLLQGPKEAIAKLRRNENFIMLQELEEPSLRRGKAPMALGIIAAVVGIAALGLFPILYTALLGCVAMVMTGCLKLEDAYEAIDWKVIFLLAGVLPLGIAMQKSGAAQYVVENTLKYAGQFGPLVMLAALYLLTAVLTECMSNNAAAVLLAPLAISMATALNVDPKPFLMAVCFAASTAFATPVGYQTNTMVYNPGGYRFTDYMKVGIPLNLLFWGLSVYFIPLFWPF